MRILTTAAAVLMLASTAAKAETLHVLHMQFHPRVGDVEVSFGWYNNTDCHDLHRILNDLNKPIEFTRPQAHAFGALRWLVRTQNGTRFFTCQKVEKELME